jgi:LPXTG-motif cell wall-anchored protein
MIKKLGNFSLLFGAFSLVTFFTSSAFLVDPVWFLIGGIGFLALGLLIKRRRKLKRDRRGILRMRRKERERFNETS